MARTRQPYTYSGERFSDSDSDESDKGDEFVDASETEHGSTAPTQASYQTQTNDELDEEEVFRYPGIDEVSEGTRGSFQTVARDWLAPSTSSTATYSSISSSDPRTTQISKFTLEDFEYLSRITAKVEQHTTLTGNSFATGLSPTQKKQDNKHEYTRSDQISDLISFDTPNDTTWSSYKPLLPFSNNHVEGVYPTAPRMPTSKRQFRQPVFQEVRRQEIPLSDDEVEKEQEMKEHVVEQKYVPPHQRERPDEPSHREGTVQQTHRSNGIQDGATKHIKGTAWGQTVENLADPQRGWRDFQPTRPKPPSPIKATLPEKAIQSDDIPSVVCDKCGSTLNLETLRQLLLLQAPVPATISPSGPTLSPALTPPPPSASLASPEFTVINGEKDLRLDQIGYETQPIVQEVPRNDILPQLKITTDFELKKVDPSAENEQFAAAAALWRTRSTPTSPKVVNGHPVVTKVSSETVKSTPNAINHGRSDHTFTNSDTTAAWKPLNHTPPTLQLSSNSENLPYQATTNEHYTRISESLDNPAQLPSNGKIPSDLLFGWGPDRNCGQTQLNTIPRVMPTSSTVGIGWDDDNNTPPRPVVNGWDPEYALKKVPSPGYAVSSQRRSPVFSAAPLDRQLAPGLDKPRYR